MKRCGNCFKTYDDRLEICPYCGYVEKDQKSDYLPIGTILNNQYYIGREIGGGGFGITYKAYDLKLDLVVAIKESYPRIMVTRSNGGRVSLCNKRQRQDYHKITNAFLNEARSIAKLNNCVNIVNVMDYFEANNTAYMVMEFLKGITLDQKLKELKKKNQYMDEKEAIAITKSILTALKAVHRAGIIHRDIKPGNIFLCENGDIKLIDFGAARVSDETKELTRTQILTPGYAPIEQYETKSKQGPFTDLYALGAVLYQMLTNIKPQESIMRKLHDDVKEAKAYRPDISDQLNNTIMRAIAVDPKIRFASAAAFSDALDGKKVNNVAKEQKLRKIRSYVVTGGIIASLVIACFFAGYYYKRSQAVFHVDATSLRVMLPIAQGSSEQETKKRFNKMIYDFKKQYPEVKFSKITCVKYTEYAKALRQSLKSEKTAPDLFVSSSLSAKDMKYLKTLPYVKRMIDLNENSYYFLNNYIQQNSKRMPTSFTIPVIYQNFTESAGTPIKISSFKSFNNNKDNRYTAYLTDDRLLATYEYALGDTSTIHDLKNHQRQALKETIKAYKNYKLKSYITDQQMTRLLRNYQKPLGFYLTDSDHIGYEHIGTDYKYNEITSKKLLYGHFNGYYSMSRYVSDKKERAASRLMAMLLDENAQNTICIESEEGLPFNKSTMVKFQNMKEQSSTSFSNVLKNLNKAHLYRFTDETDTTLDRANESYQAYLLKNIKDD